MKSHHKLITRISIIVGAIVFLILFLLIRSHFAMPYSFTLNLGQDSTSSGGGRYTESELVFEKKILVSGTLKYTTSREITRTVECSYQNNAWVGDSGEPCSISFIKIPETRRQVRQLIANKVIRPEGDACTHYNVCYSIEK